MPSRPFVTPDAPPPEPSTNAAPAPRHHPAPPTPHLLGDAVPDLIEQAPGPLTLPASPPSAHSPHLLGDAVSDLVEQALGASDHVLVAVTAIVLLLLVQEGQAAPCTRGGVGG